MVQEFKSHHTTAGLGDPIVELTCLRKRVLELSDQVAMLSSQLSQLLSQDATMESADQVRMQHEEEVTKAEPPHPEEASGETHAADPVLPPSVAALLSEAPIALGSVAPEFQHLPHTDHKNLGEARGVQQTTTTSAPQHQAPSPPAKETKACDKCWRCFDRSFFTRPQWWNKAGACRWCTGYRHGSESQSLAEVEHPHR